MLIEPIITAQTAQGVPVGPTRSEADKTQAVSETSSSTASQDVGLLKEVLGVAQKHLHISDVGLAFSVHADTGHIKVRVTEKDTGELIREIPPEGVLNLMAKIDEMMGILFDEKA
jgi:flagellar protein FlaG